MSRIIQLSVLFISLLVSACDKKPDDPPNTMRDIDGNLYKTVKIGKQTWMAENLRVTRYRNGLAIPRFTNPTEWSSSPNGLCTDINFIADSVKGLLYNWLAVEVYKDHNLAPVGWHIPTEDEWIELIMTAGGYEKAGSMLKDTLFWSPVYFPKDKVSGFNAVPAGYRDYVGRFQSNDAAHFWTSDYCKTYQYSRTYVIIFNVSDNIQVSCTGDRYGFSVRCVKD